MKLSGRLFRDVGGAGSSVLFLLPFVLLLAGCGRAASSQRPDLSPQERADLARAEQLLDGAGDRHELLGEIRAILDRVIENNPEALDAYHLLSRYHVRSGYRYPNEYDPEALQEADAVLDRVLEISPDYSRAYVQRGGVYIAMRRFSDAQTALDTARRMGSVEPWLDMNQALLLQERGEFARAAPYCNRVLSNPASGHRVKRYAYRCLIDQYERVGRDDRADAMYRELILVADDDAFTHGNHATHVLCRDDDYERAIVHAQKALSVRRDPYAYSVLSVANDRKWAAELEAGRKREAAAAWKAAREASAEDPAYQAATWCDGAAVKKVLGAMRAQGKLQRFLERDIAKKAFDGGARGFVGVFDMEVENVSYGEHGLSLTSSTIGSGGLRIVAEQRSVTVDDVRETFGNDVDAALSGKRVAYIGVVRDRRGSRLRWRPAEPDVAGDLVVELLDVNDIAIEQGRKGR
jgi:tetratricopeptide (TPR) repeat protein